MSLKYIFNSPSTAVVESGMKTFSTGSECLVVHLSMTGLIWCTLYCKYHPHEKFI